LTGASDLERTSQEHAGACGSNCHGEFNGLCLSGQVIDARVYFRKCLLHKMLLLPNCYEPESVRKPNQQQSTISYRESTLCPVRKTSKSEHRILQGSYRIQWLLTFQSGVHGRVMSSRGAKPLAATINVSGISLSVRFYPRSAFTHSCY